MNANQTHCDECRALHVLRGLLIEAENSEKSLKRALQAASPHDLNRSVLVSLVNWFELTGEEETTLEAFLAYAAAIGCTTTWTSSFIPYGGPSGAGLPKLPLITRDLLLNADKDPATIRARLASVVGTNQQAALSSFENMFRPVGP